jgi:hypothetical protein
MATSFTDEPGEPRRSEQEAPDGEVWICVEAPILYALLSGTTAQAFDLDRASPVRLVTRGGRACHEFDLPAEAIPDGSEQITVVLDRETHELIGHVRSDEPDDRIVTVLKELRAEEHDDSVFTIEE